MNKEKLLIETLERLGIHTQKELKEAMANTAINISIMTVGQSITERLVS